VNVVVRKELRPHIVELYVLIVEEHKIDGGVEAHQTIDGKGEKT